MITNAGVGWYNGEGDVGFVCPSLDLDGFAVRQS